ncbi:hypothetical protein E2562_006376 [Oryza meyeriana var. granulata]|uniref:Uncharacterized protein n=1 Tax=Oryza meyeriana var. granulata TaxID=110450 RepID=A0A6G1EFC1_9ORYZ|nr:hypothetical protein E2562_006376 [Oryza meyeriana var. granulata]
MHIWEFEEHDGVARDRVQHHHHHWRADPGDHAHWEHQGVPEHDDVEEAGDAHAATELGVVDEAEGGAARLPAAVRQFERQRWAAMHGVDECQFVRDLLKGLRRDIKYHICLDLLRQVPLFQHIDDLVLENIYDRIKSLIFPKGEIARS